MTVTIYAGGVLAYDSRLPDEAGYNVLSILINDAVNKGGTATVVLPHGHPLYNGFTAYGEPIEIYRDDVLRWRGRSLPPSDDLYGRRTIVCEGELCFLQDVIHRPYLYQDSPDAVFRAILAVYNTAADPWKRFAVGNITVTDSNDYIRLESRNPERCLDALQRMLNQCGGYILFDFDASGTRRINWYAEMPYRCNQPVAFGSNLTDLIIRSDMSGFATRIIPYGALQEDGSRLQINVDGKDYVENAEAVARRGVIERSVIYDDITLPENLYSRAMQELSYSVLIPRTFQLSAVDLSRQDLTLDAFSVGQHVTAQSPTHGISGEYDLTALTEDLVSPGVGRITLVAETASLIGSDSMTLTGATAVGDRSNSHALQRATESIRADYKKNIAVVEQQLSSSIDQTASDIRLQVESTITQRDTDIESLRKSISSLQQTADSVSIRIQSIIDNGVDKIRTSMGYTFDDNGMNISKSGEEMDNTLTHKGMYVKRSGDVILQADANGVIATDVTVRNYLIFGVYSRAEAYADPDYGPGTGVFFVR